MKPIFIGSLALAAFLIGLSFAGTKEVVKTIPGETVTLPAVEKVIHDPTDAVRIGELESQIASLTAELQKARHSNRTEALPVAACAAEQPGEAAVPSVVPTYERRRGLFGGRFRR